MISMCTEIEAKLKVDSIDEAGRKLVELGAEFLEEQIQTDYYFDDIKKTLTEGDRCLRLRRELVNNSEKFFLAYKGVREKGQFKKRQQIEMEVNDPDPTEKLLKALGYSRVLVVEKKRQLWRLRECLVALDQLPLLGNFVEIEGPDEEKIAAAQKDLGLANLPHIVESYASLVSEKLRSLRDVNE